MIFGEERPRDDFVESIKRFLLDSVARNDNSIENLEIEAKFGLIVDRHSNQRINFPVLNECIVNFEGGTNFVSDMPLELHRKFNESLNKRFSDRSLGWKYRHTRTIDHIMPSKLRITTDATSGEIVHAQRKRKLNQLEIFEPNYAMDIRISVNSEVVIPVDGGVKSEDINHPAVTKRKKDRIAYEIGQGLLSIDLTQVTQNEGHGNKIKHELELEVKDVKRLMESEEALKMFIDSLRELCQLI